MPSYTNLFICSILALGASAQNDYGYAASSAPPPASYGPVSISTSVPASSAPPPASYGPISISTSVAASSATSAVTSTASSATSSEPAKATAAAAAAVCPIGFEKGCAFLCSGPKFAPSCETEWFFSSETSCTPCPGIPDKCPPAPEPSCAFVCKAQGAAASKGDAETPFCWASDLSNENEIACTPCGGASGGSTNGTSVTPLSVSNGTASTQSYGNGTTAVPPPVYTSGASTMTIGVSAVFGLALTFFTL